MNHASASPENAIFTRAHAAREIFDKHADKLAESLLAELFGTGQSSRNPHDPKAHVSELAKRLRTLMAANSGSDFDACFADHILADAIAGIPASRIVQAYHNTIENFARLAASEGRGRSRRSRCLPFDADGRYGLPDGQGRTPRGTGKVGIGNPVDVGNHRTRNR